MNMGVAFQLKDDLLDVYGDAAVFGKNIGGDILCNKKTYMLIKALENASQEQASPFPVSSQISEAILSKKYRS